MCEKIICKREKTRLSSLKFGFSVAVEWTCLERSISASYIVAYLPKGTQLHLERSRPSGNYFFRVDPFGILKQTGQRKSCYPL